MTCPYFSRVMLTRLILVAVCSDSLSGMLSRSLGDEFVWVGDQNEYTPGIIPPGWAFNEGAMWLGLAGPPASVDDDAVFGGGYVDPFTGNPFRWGNGGTIFFGDFASIHAPLKGGPTQIEQVNAVNRNVRIQSGEWTFDFTSIAFPSSQSIGTDLGSYTITDVLNVGDLVKATGNAGTATLNIINSGLHTTTTQVGRGSVNDTSIVGTLNVLGSDTILNNSADITVGHDNGKGTLNLRDGATVTARNLVVGLVGGEGNATISHGSSLDLSGALSVGVLATFGGGGPTSNGTVTVIGGSTLNSTGFARIGESTGATGTVTINGPDSQWTNAGGSSIGFEGNGTLHILDGGEVNTFGAVFVGSENGTGHVTIGGPFTRPTSWKVQGDLDLFSGDVTINSFGELHQANGQMVVGGTTTSTTIDILDNGKMTTGTLSIGRDGVAVMDNHGFVQTVGSAHLGVNESGDGQAIVWGDDAEWSIDEFLIVGERGVGELVVNGDGRVSSKGGSVGAEATGRGSVQILGGSRWELDGELTIGGSGEGVMDVISFSSVQMSDGMIGRNDGSIGTLSLFQSTLFSVGPDRADFEVGLHGEATMSLFASLAVINNGNLFVGRGTGSTATVNVDVVSTLSINGDVIIAAGEGDGDSPSNATVNVTDGSVLETSHSLLVGEIGIGALNVSGSDIITRVGRIGVADGSEGSVSLVGSSNWTIAESLIVGENGVGTLSVSDYSFVQIDTLLQVGNQGIVNLVLSEGRINVGGGGLPTDLGILRVGEGGLLAGGGTINGDVLVDGGSLSPGFSPGILTINGDLNIASLGSMSIEIGGDIPGVDYDVLDVSGNTDIDGTIFVTLIDGYLPGRGDVFDLFRFGGDFDPLSKSQIVFTNGPAGLEYELGLTSGVASVVVTVPEVGSLSLLGVASVFVGLAARYRHKRA